MKMQSAAGRGVRRRYFESFDTCADSKGGMFLVALATDKTLWLYANHGNGPAWTPLPPLPEDVKLAIVPQAAPETPAKDVPPAEASAPPDISPDVTALL